MRKKECYKVMLIDKTLWELQKKTYAALCNTDFHP